MKRKSGSEATLMLNRVLDLRAAQPLAEDLLAMRGRPVAVDASQVEKLGGLCLQVLISGAATWRADGISLRFGDVSDFFEEQLAMFGVALPDLSALDATQ